MHILSAIDLTRFFDGIVGLELDHGPDHHPERAHGVFGERELREQGVDAVAVCFLFSYLNPEHERRAAAIVAEAAVPGIQGVLRAAGTYRLGINPIAKVLRTDFPEAAGMAPLPPPRLELEGVSPPGKKPGNPAATPSPPG